MTETASRYSPNAATRLLNHLAANPLTTLTALALSSGGLLVLFFFMRIGFMPDIDLSTSTALLFAVALVGFGTVVGYMLIAVVPGVVTTFALSECKVAPEAWTLASVIGPGVLMTLAVMANGWLFGGRLMPPGSWAPWVFAAGAIVLVATRIARLRWPRQAPDEQAAGRLRHLEAVLLLSGSAFIWMLGLITALKLALYLSRDSAHSLWVTGVLILVWLGLLIIVNLITARLPLRAAMVFAPIAAIPVLVVLMFFAGGVEAVSLHALRQLGLADVEHVDVVVRPDVCKSLRLTSSTTLRCDGSDVGSAGVLRDVVLRSRIGAQIVVEPTAPEDARTAVGSGSQLARAARLVLRKEDVLLWARR